MSRTEFTIPLGSLIAGLVFTFGAGGGYYVLGNEVDKNTQTHKVATAERNQNKTDIVSMKTDINGIKISQEHQAKDVQRILDILEKRYSGQNSLNNSGG